MRLVAIAFGRQLVREVVAPSQMRGGQRSQLQVNCRIDRAGPHPSDVANAEAEPIVDRPVPAALRVFLVGRVSASSRMKKTAIRRKTYVTHVTAKANAQDGVTLYPPQIPMASAAEKSTAANAANLFRRRDAPSLASSDQRAGNGRLERSAEDAARCSRFLIVVWFELLMTLKCPNSYSWSRRSDCRTRRSIQLRVRRCT